MSSAVAEPESSGQALERFITEQLGSLSLTVPQDDIEMMARFVEEEGIEREEKAEGVRGMLEGVVEGGELPEEGVDEVIELFFVEQERLQEAELERQAAEEEAARSPSPDEKAAKAKDILATLSPEELAAAKRQALIRQYGYLDGDQDDIDALFAQSRGDAPPRASKKLEDEERKKAEERRKLIEDALRRDVRKKKHRKDDEVDLLAPNLNKDKAHYVMAMQREAQKKASLERKDRDKAALDKQRADQAKAKADKQKKAAKQERRA